MRCVPDHPVISEMEKYGYIRRQEQAEYDEDRAYEERREREIFGEE